MPSDLAVTPLPDPDRHITDNGSMGNSFFSSAVPTALPVAKDLGDGALQRLVYLIPRGLVALSDQADLKTYQASLHNLPPLVPTDGNTVLWVIDTPPGSTSPMHRTTTLDVVIQVYGEVELILDNDEKRVLKAGDVTVQRSTMHAWRNTSMTQWSRMFAVMTECQPVQVGGQTLGTYFSPH